MVNIAIKNYMAHYNQCESKPTSTKKSNHSIISFSLSISMICIPAITSHDTTSYAYVDMLKYSNNDIAQSNTTCMLTPGDSG